jgi:hypothetical protein
MSSRWGALRFIFLLSLLLVVLLRCCAEEEHGEGEGKEKKGAIPAPSLSVEQDQIFVQSATIIVTLGEEGEEEYDKDDINMQYVVSESSAEPPKPPFELFVLPGDFISVDEPGDWLISVVASREGEFSAVQRVKITILGKVSLPELDLSGERVGDDFVRFVELTFSCPTVGADIHYTTDGSTPTADSLAAVLGEPFLITATQPPAPFSVRAIAFHEGMHHSNLASWEISITLPAVDTYPVNGAKPESPTSMWPEVRWARMLVNGAIVVTASVSRPLGYMSVLESCTSLSPATEIAERFVVERPIVARKEGETISDARNRLNLDFLESEWSKHGPGCVLGLAVATWGAGGGACEGPLVSSGEVLIAGSGPGRVSFGARNGEWVMGRIDPREAAHFQMLVPGMGWVVRGGEKYVDSGAVNEDKRSGISSHTAIGYDSHGNLMVAHCAGVIDLMGVTNQQWADALIAAGFISAVNMDGEGSASSRGSLLSVGTQFVSGPSDFCDEEVSSVFPSLCEAPVGSILCIHGIPPPLIEGSTTKGSETEEVDEGDEGGHLACATAATTNGTVTAWDTARFESVEASLHMFRVGFFVTSVIAAASICFHLKGSRVAAKRSKFSSGIELGRRERSRDDFRNSDRTGVYAPLGGFESDGNEDSCDDRDPRSIDRHPNAHESDNPNPFSSF